MKPCAHGKDQAGRTDARGSTEQASAAASGEEGLPGVSAGLLGSRVEGRGRAWGPEQLSRLWFGSPVRGWSPGCELSLKKSFTPFLHEGNRFNKKQRLSRGKWRGSSSGDGVTQTGSSPHGGLAHACAQEACLASWSSHKASAPGGPAGGRGAGITLQPWPRVSRGHLALTAPAAPPGGDSGSEASSSSDGSSGNAVWILITKHANSFKNLLFERIPESQQVAQRSVSPSASVRKAGTSVMATVGAWPLTCAHT